ncbi:Na(+)/H(+) antiporter subunit B [Gracilibacillus alcaliphilus]|uniref:Na(+)/H(+) antiporter subunit B n=1 Tax=Gracilibacillus alcaliphilus TaxID=1401441 RepID=UPI00195B9862|nr:Na(+)/H(+) antiporter subunit B [Gracilibacillus alcaliphilus]MBM7677001.1 multicomponent Na+:H+ antiporter subunit B [Gracilibacillus alcaliphilus]
MKPIKPNDMMLQTLARLIILVVLSFSIYLLLAGHNNPGGGFIGGLMTSSAILILYVAFDMKTIKKAIPIDFVKIIGIGLLFASLTGVVSMLFGYPYLKQFFDYFTIPILGEVELTTALPFDLGVYFVVVGSALTIILTIAEDDK